MRLFIATRWGNRFDDDGADGTDTNFIVRAETREAAAALGDAQLRFEAPPPGGRGIERFVQAITQIGTCDAGAGPAILFGPVIFAPFMTNVPYDSWHRDAADGPWTPFDG